MSIVTISLLMLIREECLGQLSNNLQTSKGVPVVDVMCFFHGDGPEKQFES